MPTPSLPNTTTTMMMSTGTASSSTTTAMATAGEGGEGTAFAGFTNHNNNNNNSGSIVDATVVPVPIAIATVIPPEEVDTTLALIETVEVIPAHGYDNHSDGRGGGVTLRSMRNGVASLATTTGTMMMATFDPFLEYDNVIHKWDDKPFVEARIGSFFTNSNDDRCTTSTTTPRRQHRVVQLTRQVIEWHGASDPQDLVLEDMGDDHRRRHRILHGRGSDGRHHHHHSIRRSSTRTNNATTRLLLSVTHDQIPNQRIVRISGTWISKVYEGTGSSCGSGTGTGSGSGSGSGTDDEEEFLEWVDSAIADVNFEYGISNNNNTARNNDNDNNDNDAEQFNSTGNNNNKTECYVHYPYSPEQHQGGPISAVEGFSSSVAIVFIKISD